MESVLFGVMNYDLKYLIMILEITHGVKKITSKNEWLKLTVESAMFSIIN